MEDQYSVSSPRRILSLSKRKRATVYFQDPDDKGSGFGVAGEHGLKTSEVYGFVGSITTIVATGSYLLISPFHASYRSCCCLKSEFLQKL